MKVALKSCVTEKRSKSRHFTIYLLTICARQDVNKKKPYDIILYKLQHYNNFTHSPLIKYCNGRNIFQKN